MTLGHAIDGKPDPLILSSHGGDCDPRMFYATTYRTLHNGRNTVDNASAERRLNTQFRWNTENHRGSPDLLKGNIPMSKSSVQSAGYQRNLLPHFEYDKNVDEDLSFVDDDHYASVQQKSYRNPSDVPTRSNRAVVVLTQTPDFDKYRPLNSHVDVKLNPEWNEFESTMKASYKKNELFPHLKLQESIVTGRDHETGWVRNRPHAIGGLHDPLRIQDPQRRQKRPQSSEKQNDAPIYITSHGRVTGFGRPDAAFPEFDTSRMPDPQKIPMERLRKENPTEYQYLLKNFKGSLPSALVISNGLKEITAGAHEAQNHEIMTPLNFRSWDSTYSASYDPSAINLSQTPESPNRVNRTSNRSGYSMCNKYEFESFDAASPLAPNGRNATSDAMLLAARAREEMSLHSHIG